MQLADLPSVDRVLGTEAVAGMVEAYRREWVVDMVRQELEEARDLVRQGAAAPTALELGEQVCRRVESMFRAGPRRVINATGVILHTNLGRAPLSRAANDAASGAAAGYTNLELDLAGGGRGSRQAHLRSLIGQLTGAESALAVNNNASALLLALYALAAGKEVVVSRGEAVEIGGGFRIPDVLRQSGSILVDVGTTNRTYVRDYEQAINDNTAALLKVHASNFRVEGFTASVETRELAALGERYGIPVLHDVGSGCLLATEKYGLSHEPRPQESAAAGAGLVLFSGDKLLGGPQAGIVAGKRDLVERLERHPLARAVRIDKLNLAALTATLLHYIAGDAEKEVPVWRMISTPSGEIKERVHKWQLRLGSGAEVKPSRSAIGGGSLPGETLPSWVLALPCRANPGGADETAARLRGSDRPVVARVEGDCVLLDPRTVLPEDEEDLVRSVRRVLEGDGST